MTKFVTPSVLDEKVEPHYKRVTDHLKEHNINIVSLDCDRCIDVLIPTWKADIRSLREKYGKELRGVGGMNKNVFAMDKAAFDKEVERLKELVSLGDYIPYSDHRIPPEAKFLLVAYYCELLDKTVF